MDKKSVNFDGDEYAMTPKGEEYVAKILNDFKEGKTIEEIGKELGLTKEQTQLLFVLGEMMGVVE